MEPLHPTNKCHHWVSNHLSIPFGPVSGYWFQCTLPAGHNGSHRIYIEGNGKNCVITWNYLDTELLYWTGLVVTKHLCKTVNKKHWLSITRVLPGYVR